MYIELKKSLYSRTAKRNSMELRKNLKTLKVFDKTHARLYEHLLRGETYDSLINRAIDEIEKNKKK